MELEAAVEALRNAFGVPVSLVSSEALPESLTGLSDEHVVAVLEAASALVRGAQRVQVVAAGVASARSSRASGHSGLVQSRGHRNPAGFVQEITGVSRAEAQRQVRVGEALIDAGAVVRRDESPEAGPLEDARAERPSPWHAPLGSALLAGTLSSAQHDAICRGLGEPPVSLEGAPDGLYVLDDASGEGAANDADSTVEAWRAAAEQLIAEAEHRTVEELGAAARLVRDVLDPDGALARFEKRFESRSFRMYTDADGLHRASISFDDEGGAWVKAILDAALRPRRGGPRFVDPDEKKQAEELVEDARSNDQLAYDLIVDVLRAGALADAEAVFGTRQAGIRLVQTIDPDGTVSPVSYTEDGLVAVPTAVAGQHQCNSGTTPCLFDKAGNPLNVGREHRLFTPVQRVALALRDGGCRWKGCDRPASYCEAHHIDEWKAHEGRTDIDRGILLCRFHHMQLHYGGWRITREGKDDFVLHPPGRGDPIPLKPRLALT